MIVNVEQRWKEGGRSVFVPPQHTVTDLSAYEVAEIPDDTTARQFVERYHYSGTYVAARERGGALPAWSPRWRCGGEPSDVRRGVGVAAVPA